MILNSNLNVKNAEISRSLPRVENLDITHEMNLFFLRSQLYTNQNFGIQNTKKIAQKKFHSEEKKNTLKPTAQKIFSKLSSESIFINPEFKLEFSKKIETTLCKGKYFSFKVSLKSLCSISFPIKEKIELEVLVFTMDDILITKNMKGKDILRGNFIQSMNYFTMDDLHVAYFRIQVTEVSSHFVEKKLKLKIRARKSEFLRATGWKIQSLTVAGISVKAKDPKSDKC